MFRGDNDRLQHLMRRAAFGCRPSEFAHWQTLGLEGSLEALLNYEAVPDNIEQLPLDAFGNLVTASDTDSVKRYWIYRLCDTARPLEETMTLFWHGHFATADYKVQNGNLMWKQNRLLRANALGSFRTLVSSIATDPAMLIWLDGNINKRRSPNENFSRELLELFSMGVDGGYTERDVKEGARAFTGWSYDDDASRVGFDLSTADTGVKNYLGKEGNWTLDQAVDIVVRHPSTAKFLSRKLFEFFVHDNPPASELDRLSSIYFQSKFSIRSLVRGVLSSPRFYSEDAFYSRVKSPVQYAVSTGKALDIPFKWINDVQTYTDGMGQQLFNPPNVKGWKTGRSWINTNTMTARLNFAAHAVDARRYRGIMQPHVKSALKIIGKDADREFDRPDTAVDAIAEWLLPGVELQDSTRKALVAYMSEGASKDAKRDVYWQKASGLVELVLTCPEFQLA